MSLRHPAVMMKARTTWKLSDVVMQREKHGLRIGKGNKISI